MSQYTREDAHEDAFWASAITASHMTWLTDKERKEAVLTIYAYAMSTSPADH